MSYINPSSPLLPRRLRKEKIKIGNVNIKDRLRQEKAVALRRAGLTYEEVAIKVGYASGQVAYQAIRNRLKVRPNEDAKECRVIELERLDSLFEAVYADAIGIRSKTRKMLDENDNPIKDKNGDYVMAWDIQPHLPSMEKCLSITDRRRALLGLDAPKVIKQDITIDKIVDPKELSDEDLVRIIQAGTIDVTPIKDNGNEEPTE